MKPRSVAANLILLSCDEYSAQISSSKQVIDLGEEICNAINNLGNFKSVHATEFNPIQTKLTFSP